MFAQPDRDELDSTSANGNIASVRSVLEGRNIPIVGEGCRQRPCGAAFYLFVSSTAVSRCESLEKGIAESS
jgi:hypothetical protein